MTGRGSNTRRLPRWRDAFGPGVLRGVWAAVLVATAACAPQSETQLLAHVDRSIAAGEWRKASVELKAFLQRQPESRGARVRLGHVALETGSLADAVRELEHARALGADANAIELLYARALLGLKRYQDIVDHIDPQSVTQVSERVDLLRIRGDALFGLSRSKDAIEAYDNALALDAKNVDALLGRAFAVMQLDGLEAALATLDRAASFAPDDPRVEAARGTLYLQARNFVQAESTFTALLGKMREDDLSTPRLAGLAGLAEAQLALDKLEGAQLSTGRLYQLVPGSPVAMYLRARYLFLVGDYGEAQGLLEQLLTRDQDNMQARLLLGAVNFAQGNLGQADMHLSSVLAGEPSNSFARMLLATARLRENKPREALDALGPDLTRGDAQTLSLAGRASIQAGDVDAGLAYLEHSAADNPADANRLLQLAAGYIVAGRFDQAVKTLEQVPAGGDAGYRRSLLLVNTRMREKDMKGALRQAQSFAEAYPDDALAQATLGGLLAANGNLDDARRQFMRAAELGPKNAVAQLNLAKLDILQRRTEDAEKHLRAARALAPESSAILVATSQLELMRGNTSEALKGLETARQRDPKAAEPRLLLAQYRLATRDFTSAATLAGEVLEVAPDSSSALNILGLALAGSGRAEEGVAALKRASAASPASAMVEFNLARAEMAAGHQPEAMAAVRRSLERQPEFPPALALAAALSVRSNDLAAAGAYLERLRKVDPKHPAIFLVGGDMAVRSGKYAEAASIYARGRAQNDSRELAMREFAVRRRAGLPDPTVPLEAWLKKSPQDVRVRRTLAQAQQEAGARANAIANYELVVQEDDRDFVALNNLALLYQETGDKRAVPTARRAYELAPTTAAVADTYGWLLLLQGDGELAMQILDKAAAVAPDAREIQYHRAAALARTGRTDTAREVLSSALADGAKFVDRESAEQLLANLNDRSGSRVKE